MENITKVQIRGGELTQGLASREVRRIISRKRNLLSRYFLRQLVTNLWSFYLDYGLLLGV